jgi:hypothetical protein
VASGLIQEGGIYVATSGNYQGMPIGSYEVIVLPPRMDPKEEEAIEKKNSQAVMNALIKRDKKELEKVAYPQDEFVPRRYWKPNESGLTFTVAEGENKADFELTKAKKN